MPKSMRISEVLAAVAAEVGCYLHVLLWPDHVIMTLLGCKRSEFPLYFHSTMTGRSPCLLAVHAHSCGTYHI
jgi:hypothetical protein